MGNLKANPRLGITLPDFETSDVLYVSFTLEPLHLHDGANLFSQLTGTAEILIGDEAADLLEHTRIAVKLTIEQAKFVKSGLPFRGELVDYSPYSPPVRTLVSEKTSSTHAITSGRGRPDITASFVRRELLTPTIARITFKLDSEKTLQPWKSGQAITFDFKRELDNGWSHMRDDDPQSLNDDFIRSFTVSSVAPSSIRRGSKDAEFQITVRKHGPATALLWRWNPRVELEIPVLGFGGEEGFLMPTEKTTNLSVFVAGGVGITPLIAQADSVLAAGNGLRLLWSIRAEDLPLAADVFGRVRELAPLTTLFVTGGPAGGQDRLKGELTSMGASIFDRRMEQADLKAVGGERNRKFYLCAAPALTKLLLGWLEGEDAVYENFNY